MRGMLPHNRRRKNKLDIIAPKQYPPLYRCSAQLQERVIFLHKNATGSNVPIRSGGHYKLCL